MALVWGSGFEDAPGAAGRIAGRSGPARAIPPPRSRARQGSRSFCGRSARSLAFLIRELRRPPARMRAGWSSGPAGRAVASTWREHGPAKTSAGTGRAARTGNTDSALVVGNGRKALVLGLGRAVGGSCLDSPFRFGGCGAPRDALPAVAQAFDAARICRADRVRGLNSVDFLVPATPVTLLEVNPRPGASTRCPGRSLRAEPVCIAHRGLPRAAASAPRAFCRRCRCRIVYARRMVAAVPEIRLARLGRRPPAAGTVIARRRAALHCSCQLSPTCSDRR